MAVRGRQQGCDFHRLGVGVNSPQAGQEPKQTAPCFSCSSSSGISSSVTFPLLKSIVWVGFFNCTLQVCNKALLLQHRSRSMRLFYVRSLLTRLVFLGRAAPSSAASIAAKYLSICLKQPLLNKLSQRGLTMCVSTF